MIKTLILPLRKSAKNYKKLELPEQILVKGIIEKNGWAYERLYQLYSANLLGITLQIVSHQETAEDLLQESFSKIFTNIGLYDDQKARLFTWMLNICRNTAIDYLRKKSTRNSNLTCALDKALPEIESRPTNSIATDCIGLKSIIATLPEKQRRILDLVYFHGYSHVEAAEELQMPLGSLKTSLRSAVISLRKFFNEAEQKKSA